MAPFPAPETGILLTHFVVSEDIACSRDFYASVLGGEVVSESPAVVALANGWIIINAGGGPTDDKPAVTRRRVRSPEPRRRDHRSPRCPRLERGRCGTEISRRKAVL